MGNQQPKEIKSIDKCVEMTGNDDVYIDLAAVTTIDKNSTNTNAMELLKWYQNL